jgi:signal transduction histidine kinase
MQWWLGLTFALVAGFTAVAVVGVFSSRAATAFRTHAREFAVGNALAVSEALKADHDVAALRREAEALAARRGISLFVFDERGRLLTGGVSEGVRWAAVPQGAEALRLPPAGGRYIGELDGGSAYVVAVRIYGGNHRVLVAYMQRPELQEQLGVVREQSLWSALLAFSGGAALGLLIATLIARRLARFARAAQAIGEGDFSSPAVTSRFPDEVGSLGRSLESMRVQLQELFRRLEQERDRLESLLDRLNEGVLLVNRELDVEFANGRARELLAVGDRLDECGFGDEQAQARVRKLALGLFRSGRPSHLQLEGESRTLSVSGIPPGSRGDNAIVVVADESEQERNERVQREFAANAAHELRTPLASIVTAVEMLQTGAKDEPPQRDRFLGVIAREADRLTRLTHALLVLARAEARQEQPHLVPVRVAPLLESIADALPHTKGVEVGVDCPPSLSVAGDPDLLEQAISSVALNAVRYTSAGSVEMRGRSSNGSVVIEVADTGPGIPEDERERIFDRFYRGNDGGRGGDGGFGLGLAIARRAVRTLGGEIELRSEQAVGTTARIILAKPEQGGQP